MIRRLFILAVVLMAVRVEAFAQYYHAGEQLEYRVSYRAKLFPNTEMATATVDTTLDTLGGQTVYRVYGRGRMMPSYRWFFDIDDRYTIWVDTATLRTQQFLSEIREGSYEKNSRFRYDWQNMQAHNTWTRRNGPERSRTLDLTPQSMDAISLFFNMRGVDDAQFRDDDPQSGGGQLEMMLEDTVRVLKYRFMGRETKRIGRLGKFRTLKFACQIGTEDAFSFTDGSEFFIWISDDRNKVPLWLESPIRIGSICAVLVSYKGLKYPAESKVK